MHRPVSAKRVSMTPGQAATTRAAGTADGQLTWVKSVEMAHKAEAVCRLRARAGTWTRTGAPTSPKAPDGPK